MNKKGIIPIIILVILVAVFFWFVFHYLNKESNYSEKNCPELLTNITEVKVYEQEFIPGRYTTRNWVLENGVILQMQCATGMLEGENTNYAYCESKYLKEAEVDGEGIVGKGEVFWFKLILDKRTCKRGEKTSSGEYKTICDIVSWECT